MYYRTRNSRNQKALTVEQKTHSSRILSPFNKNHQQKDHFPRIEINLETDTTGKTRIIFSGLYRKITKKSIKILLLKKQDKTGNFHSNNLSKASIIAEQFHSVFQRTILLSSKAIMNFTTFMWKNTTFYPHQFNY